MLTVPIFDGTIEGWSRAAGAAVRAGVHPSSIAWSAEGELFPTAGVPESYAPAPRLAVPRAFGRMARAVACHRDERRWALLYEALWRIVHGEPELLSVATDPLVHRLLMMHRAVRRAAHKMKAFVRFRRVETDDGEQYVAWFEPAHAVVERTAPFFARRFTSMRWSILTPDRCAHWDLRELTFTPGLPRGAAPSDDALESLWRTYYASTFNPARLNPRLMRAEMPLRYWAYLPEAALIPELERGARARVSEMLEQHRAPITIAATAPSLPRRALIPAELDVAGEWDPVHDPGVGAARDRDLAVLDRDKWGRVMHAETPIDCGVAGWTDPTLLHPGLFYPEECTTPEDRLRHYATRFPLVEVDSTYYVLPSRANAAAWAARTPAGFAFDIKAHSLMTGHPTQRKRLPDWLRRELRGGGDDTARPVYGADLPTELQREVWRRFLEALQPLRDAGKLGAIMLQFPPWFEPTRASAAVLRAARELLGNSLATVELRNRAWMEWPLAERTLALLRDLQLSYVIVDAPPGMRSSMPPTVAVTNEALAVVRLHGRRVATWEVRNEPVTERYRYLYDAGELEEWAQKIIGLASSVRRVHVTYNNNHGNYATTNAAEMAALLRMLAAPANGGAALRADGLRGAWSV